LASRKQAIIRGNPPRTISATTALSVDDSLVVCDTDTGGAFTVTLPDAASLAGNEIYLKANNTLGNTLTVDTSLSQTIDGASSVTLNQAQDYLLVVSDGSNWQIESSKSAGGSGSASFGLFNPLVGPASPNAGDIETWTNLPSGWAVWAPGSGTLSQSRSIDRGCMVLDIGTRAAGSGPACTGIYRAIPTDTEWAAYTRLTLIGPRTATGVFVECGFGVADDLAGAPDTSRLDVCDVFQEDANSILTAPRAIGLTNYASGTSPKSGAPSAYQFAGSFWFRIRKTNPSDTTSYAADYSADGVRWQSLHIGASFSTGSTPDHLVIYARSTPSGTTTCPGYRVVVGPLRFATGAGSNDLESLIPAGTSL